MSNGLNNGSIAAGVLGGIGTLHAVGQAMPWWGTILSAVLIACIPPIVAAVIERIKLPSTDVAIHGATDPDMEARIASRIADELDKRRNTP